MQLVGIGRSRAVVDGNRGLLVHVRLSVAFSLPQDMKVGNGKPGAIQPV